MRLARKLLGATMLMLLSSMLSLVAAEASSKPTAAKPATPARLAPQIFQVTPVKVVLRLQPNIMILGQNLTATTRVEVGARPAETLDASDSYHLLVKLPADLPVGSYLIRVTNEAGTVTADDRLQIDGGGPELSNMTFLLVGGFLALFVLVMRLARTPSFA